MRCLRAQISNAGGPTNVEPCPVLLRREHPGLLSHRLKRVATAPRFPYLGDPSRCDFGREGAGATKVHRDASIR
jgi:hypothetical protein